jgi:hypothetical protein
LEVLEKRESLIFFGANESRSLELNLLESTLIPESPTFSKNDSLEETGLSVSLDTNGNKRINGSEEQDIKKCVSILLFTHNNIRNFISIKNRELRHISMSV